MLKVLGNKEFDKNQKKGTKVYIKSVKCQLFQKIISIISKLKKSKFIQDFTIKVAITKRQKTIKCSYNIF